MTTLWVSLIVETGVGLAVATAAVKWARSLVGSTTSTDELISEEA